MIEFKCKQCGEGMDVPDSLSGQPLKCPNCGLWNRVPVPSRASLPEPAQSGESKPRILSDTEADALAANLAQSCPSATMSCGTCKTSFSLLAADGRASMTCPNCKSPDSTKPKWSDLPEQECYRKGGPLARQYAEEKAAENPEAYDYCSRCEAPYPVVQPGGVLNVACPRCGEGTYEEIAFSVLKRLAEDRFREKNRVADVAEASAAYPGRVAPPGLVVPIWCSNCGAASEAPSCLTSKEATCPECGKTYAAADRLAAHLIAFFGPDDASWCDRCKKSYPTMKFGKRCPRCGDTPAEEICEGALINDRKYRGDWRKIKRLGELLSAAAADGKTPRFICPFCRVELPEALTKCDFRRVCCPACSHDDVYVYNREAFRSPDDCERVMEFRLEKRKKAEKKVRDRELAKAASEIATGAKPDGGQANGGYVYVLINAAMHGHVKVGLTEREPEDRARELSAGTGIPTPFVVAYAEWFKDCYAGEKYVHALLEQKGFRVTQNREFFCAPVKAAIQAVMKAKERDEEDGGSPPKGSVVK